MKKSNIYIIVTFLGCFVMSSCHKFLDIVPATSLSSATFFKTDADFKQAINGAYQPLRGIYAGNAWALEELHSDNAYYTRNVLFGAVNNSENLSDFSLPTSNGITANTYVRDHYRQEYLVIARTNQILSTIDDVDFEDASVKDNVKGQALFLRAFAYFDLVQLFGKIPLHLEPVQNRQEAALPLSSVDSVYDQIIEDAKGAASLLPPKSEQEPGRATVGTAKTLLGNIYIVLKKWHDAETNLMDVVKSGEYELMSNYVDAFSNTNGNKNNKESVFEIQYMESPKEYGWSYQVYLPRPITAKEVQSILGVSDPSPLGSDGICVPSPDLIESYESGDKRKDASIGYITLNNSLRSDKVFPYIKKLARKHSLFGYSGNNISVYRYAGVYLMLAEALNEQGKTGDAAIYLDRVRNRAGLGNTTATSEDDMRQVIYHERRVELAFENKRWFDLVRTGRVKDVMSAYGKRVIADPVKWYYSEGAKPHDNAFTDFSTRYPLPAEESALSPYF